MMVAYEVSTRVNSPKNNDPSLLAGAEVPVKAALADALQGELIPKS